jgi:hypothetical protein
MSAAIVLVEGFFRKTEHVFGNGTTYTSFR